jgi:hypothetical protein
LSTSSVPLTYDLSNISSGAPVNARRDVLPAWTLDISATCRPVSSVCPLRVFSRNSHWKRLKNRLTLHRCSGLLGNNFSAHLLSQQASRPFSIYAAISNVSHTWPTLQQGSALPPGALVRVGIVREDHSPFSGRSGWVIRSVVFRNFRPIWLNFQAW